MTKTIAITSFRGGTGKSTITGNMAVHLAESGNSVLIIDADVRTPGVNALFGLDEGSFKDTFTDFLTGKCDVSDIVYDISDVIRLKQGKLFIIPSSLSYTKIANILVSSYSFELIKKGFIKLTKEYGIDYILIDTHSGINDASLIAAELSDAVLLVARPDNQDYQGLTASAEVSKKLRKDTYMILNMVHSKSKTKDLVKQVEKGFGFPVIAAIPHSDEVMEAESRYVFYDKNPRHAFSRDIKKIIAEILGRKPSDALRRSN